MSNSFLLVVVVLSIIQQYTTGLTCYECYMGGAGCEGSSFRKNGVAIKLTSTATNVSCSKYTYASNSEAADRSISTDCQPGTVAATDTTDAYTVYCCYTDLCNTTSIKSASILLAMATAALCIFYKK